MTHLSKLKSKDNPPHESEEVYFPKCQVFGKIILTEVGYLCLFREFYPGLEISPINWRLFSEYGDFNEERYKSFYWVSEKFTSIPLSKITKILYGYQD